MKEKSSSSILRLSPRIFQLLQIFWNIFANEVVLKQEDLVLALRVLPVLKFGWSKQKKGTRYR